MSVSGRRDCWSRIWSNGCFASRRCWRFSMCSATRVTVADGCWFRAISSAVARTATVSISCRRKEPSLRHSSGRGAWRMRPSAPQRSRRQAGTCSSLSSTANGWVPIALGRAVGVRSVWRLRASIPAGPRTVRVSPSLATAGRTVRAGSCT